MKYNTQQILQFIQEIGQSSFFDLDNCSLETLDFQKCLEEFEDDYLRYYPDSFNINKVKYFRGLLATFFYRLSRYAYLNQEEDIALELSTLSSYITGIELYYSAEIGSGLKINHGVGTVIGARSKVGSQVLLHQNVTLGEKNGRPTIGNQVIIYPGAVIVGPITIGNRCIIGANTFLDKSLPHNTIFK